MTTRPGKNGHIAAETLFRNKLFRGVLVRKLSLFWLSILLLSLAGCITGPTFYPDAHGVEVDGLPPDPGLAGKTTVEGVDSNNNGFRDDVERYIALNYPELSEEQNLWLNRYASRLQDAINYTQFLDIEELGLLENAYTDARSKAQEISENKSLSRLSFGLVYGGYYQEHPISPEDDERRYRYYDITSDIEAYVMNTLERTKAYAVYNGLLDATTYSVPKKREVLEYMGSAGGQK